MIQGVRVVVGAHLLQQQVELVCIVFCNVLMVYSSHIKRIGNKTQVLLEVQDLSMVSTFF